MDIETAERLRRMRKLAYDNMESIDGWSIKNTKIETIGKRDGIKACRVEVYIEEEKDNDYERWDFLTELKQKINNDSRLKEDEKSGRVSSNTSHLQIVYSENGYEVGMFNPY